MANIINLEIPYPDFVNGDIIRDQEIDDNNTAVVNKINEVVNKVNVHDADIVEVIATADGAVVLATEALAYGEDTRAYVDQVAADFVLGSVAPGSIILEMLNEDVTNEIDSLNGAVDAVEADVIVVENNLLTKLAKNADVLESYSEKLSASTPAASSTLTLDLSVQNTYNVTPSGNFTLAFSNVPTTGKAISCTVIVNQGATAYSITFPASIKWSNDSIPDISGVNKTHVLSFISINGGTRWYGFANLNYTT